MRLLTPVWTSPRVKPPFGSVRINWAHPLARGLAFLVLFRRDEPTGGVDLVRGGQGVTSLNPWRSTRGFFIQSGASAFSSWTDAAVGGDTPYIAASGLTLCWRGVVQTAAANAFVCKYLTETGVDEPFQYNSGGGGTTAQFLRANAGGIRLYEGGTGVLNAVVEWTTTVADESVETTPLGYMNGAPFTYSLIAGGASGAVTGTGGPLRIGRRVDGAIQLTGEVVHVAIWSRALSAAEVGAFYAEPYALLTPVAQPLPTLDIPQADAGVVRSRLRQW